MRREPLNTSGSVLIIPDWEVAREEKRIFVLGLHPKTWFENRVRRIVVFEIKTPDEEVWNDWGKFLETTIYPMETMVLMSFFGEIYRLGIRDREEIYQKWEEFVHAPDWVEFCNDVFMHRGNKEWWKNVKPKFEELKQKKVDTLYSRGKYLGDIEFVMTFDYPTGEEVREMFRQVALVNGFSVPVKKYGKECGYFINKMIEKENALRKAYEESLEIIV